MPGLMSALCAIVFALLVDVVLLLVTDAPLLSAAGGIVAFVLVIALAQVFMIRSDQALRRVVGPRVPDADVAQGRGKVTERAPPVRTCAAQARCRLSLAWLEPRRHRSKSNALTPGSRSLPGSRTRPRGALVVGLRRRPADPLGVRAGPRGARRRHAPVALRALHRRQGGRAQQRPVVHDHRPGHGGAARRGRTRRHRGRATRRSRSRVARSARMGRPARSRARQVPLPDRAHPPGAQPRVRGPGDARQRQADQGDARRRRAARRRALLVLRRLGGQARVRVPGPHAAAAGCRGAGHPVELPAADAGLEDRAGARGRQHGGAQAGELHAAVGAAVRRRLPPGGPAAGRRQHHHRTRRDRSRAGQASRRGQGRLHRLDRGRQGDRPGASPGRTRR